MSAPSQLRSEHFGDGVLGLGEPTPRLSWHLPVGAKCQDAYEIELGGRSQGWISWPRSCSDPLAGPPLGSRQEVGWRVRVETDLGESDWSRVCRFELGLLEDRDWVARWIEPVETERSAHALRHTFPVNHRPRKARLYATAHGIYECFLNGVRQDVWSHRRGSSDTCSNNQAVRSLARESGHAQRSRVMYCSGIHAAGTVKTAIPPAESRRFCLRDRECRPTG